MIYYTVFHRSNTVFITELNQHRILDQRYLQKLKIRTLLMGLEEKSKNPVECQCRICRTFVPNLGFI